jgi:steroid delta-isomerase-like uncharacterized protein
MTPHDEYRCSSGNLSPQDVVRAWIDAFNRRGAAAAIALYHPDAINMQFALGAPAVGRNAIHAGLVEFLAAFPDNYTHPENLVTSGDWVALEWSGGGTWKGPFAGHTPNGRSFTLRGSGFFQIRDGLIQEQRGYWDRATWFAQLGIPLE